MHNRRHPWDVRILRSSRAGRMKLSQGAVTFYGPLFLGNRCNRIYLDFTRRSRSEIKALSLSPLSSSSQRDDCVVLLGFLLLVVRTPRATFLPPFSFFLASTRLVIVLRRCCKKEKFGVACFVLQFEVPSGFFFHLDGAFTGRILSLNVVRYY